MENLIFPWVSEVPVDEYDKDECLFAKAFPWLFPGGLGDVNGYCDEEKLSIDGWAKKLLLYKDGRFAKDKMWSFFALNYFQRHKNQKQGTYFVDNFYKDGPQTLDELKHEIENGSCRWVENITYFGGFVPGSPSYWRRRRDEIYSWINHHIAQGNGPPTAFMTLSCAEYYWPDISRLINERQRLANEPITDFSQPGASKAVNDYTLVIQEYFQIRVKRWFETIGKNVFKIKHYWLRYEFAPGRGQIHAHCLLIMDNQDLQRLVKHARTVDKKAELLKDWAEDTVGLAAAIPPQYDFEGEIDKKDHPARYHLSDINNIQEDAVKLVKTCQYHICTDYCMRKRRKVGQDESAQDKQRRVCRSGCGIERTPGAADTPGFPACPRATIKTDQRGTRLELPRPSTQKQLRMVQSSIYLCQSWRANCDFQYMYYDTDPSFPDAEEIARVTDYVVAYACKGVETVQAEKSQTISLIKSAQEKSETTDDVRRVARQILNRSIGEKLISKQECMVQLLGLDLFLCSESIETISLSG